MKSSLFKKIVSLIFLLSFFIPFFTKGITVQNPLKYTTIEELIEGLIDFLFWAAVAIAPLMVIVAAFFFLTAGGNPDKIRTAKNIILYTVIGFTIALLAKGLISVVKGVLGG